MPKPKLPPDVFDSYVPPPPPRAIVVSTSLMAFCQAVYDLGFEPSDTWRATSVEQAHDMQQQWAGQGVKSYVVPLPEMLRGREDETADENAEAAEAA